MKKIKNENIIKFKKSRRVYDGMQIIRGVGVGIALSGFGASQSGFFNNFDINKFSSLQDFATQFGTSALNYYKSIFSKFLPLNSIPSITFVSLAGGLAAFMIASKIKKRKFTTATVKSLSEKNIELSDANKILSENNNTLQKNLTEITKKIA